MKKKMLFIGCVVLMLLQSCMVSKTPTHSFFNSADLRGAEIVSVNVPMWLAKPIVKKALRQDGNEEMVDLVRKFSDIKIMTVANTNGNLKMDLSRYFKQNNFEEWVTIKKDSDVIKLQAKQSKDAIKKMMFTVNSADQFVVIDIKGKFTPEDISRIINYTEKNDMKKIIASAKENK